MSFGHLMRSSGAGTPCTQAAMRRVRGPECGGRSAGARVLPVRTAHPCVAAHPAGGRQSLAEQLGGATDVQSRKGRERVCA